MRLHLSLFLFSLLFVTGCVDDSADKGNATSADVPGLSSFSFLAKNNTGLYQDIVFLKQDDNSYQASVVHEVVLNDITPTFDYKGNTTLDGKSILSSVTRLSLPDEFIIRFENKPVIFRVVRVYLIPTIYINTEGSDGVTSKEEYIHCSVRIDAKNMFEDFSTGTSDSARIRGRGNSTWKYYDKKPYRLQLESKKELLGMAAAKTWVLLANYRDPTNFMNAIVFDMAHYMEIPYTNTNRFVEVYMDNQYIGMYQLTQQIQQGTNRINIDEATGVLLNLDLDDGPTYSPGASDNFTSAIYGLPVAVKFPEDPTPIQRDAIKSDFAELEQLIKNHDMQALSVRLDIPSMIDFLIIQEMTRNVELVSPRSMYLYKDADNVYHFGPVWDFDGGFAFDWASMRTGHNYFDSQSWLMGRSNPSLHPSSAYNYIPGFFVDVFADADFVAAYKARWADVEKGMLSYCFNKLDGYALHCETAMKNNAKRWPIDKDYKIEIERMKAWLTTRAANYNGVVKMY
jgi:hypothetical protein